MCIRDRPSARTERVGAPSAAEELPRGELWGGLPGPGGDRVGGVGDSRAAAFQDGGTGGSAKGWDGARG
eukprot:8484542-Alexandrium_andersonii.AAC.1